MKHVFLSYVRENQAQVDRLAADLTARGVEVWVDRERILPGQRWRNVIQRAIKGGSFFLACFSEESQARSRAYMHEELTLAIEELRQMPRHRTWFIPVLLSGAEIPEVSLGGGETLHDLHWVDLSTDWQSGVRKLVEAINASPEPQLPAAVARLQTSPQSQSTGVAVDAGQRRIAKHWKSTRTGAFLLVAGITLVAGWAGLQLSLGQPPASSRKAGPAGRTRPRSEARLGSAGPLASPTEQPSGESNDSAVPGKAPARAVSGDHQVDYRGCSTWTETFNGKEDAWWPSATGGFGIIDSAFKVEVTQKDSGDKRCVHCKVNKGDLKISATIRADARASSWGLYTLDMSEARGEMYTFELSRDGKASIRHYPPDGKDVALWTGNYAAQSKARLTLEAIGGLLVASVDGAILGRAAFDVNAVPEVPLGTGFLVRSDSKVPTTVWFDDYELTYCVSPKA